MNISTIIFDMDGVIIDSEPVLFALEIELFNELGLKVPRDEHLSFVGTPDIEMWATLKKRYGLIQEISLLTETGRLRYRDYLDKNGPPALVPGVMDLIGRVAGSGFQLAIASSSSRVVIKQVCERYTLKRYFSVIVSGEDVSHGKPSPEIFLRAAQLIGSDPAECLVIEDSHNGVRAAKSAGMRCAGYKNPNSGEQDLSAADIVVTSFKELTDEKIKRLAVSGIC